MPGAGHPLYDRGQLLMLEPGGRGGNTDYTTQLTRALVVEGWLISLATADDHRYQATPGVSIQPVFHYVRGRTGLARYVRRWRMGPIANGIRFLFAIPRLMYLSRWADIVHCQGWEFTPLGLVAVACLRLTGVPVVQTVHNTFERGRAWERTHRALSRLTARTIVHTEADVARVGQVDSRVVMIPHGEYGPLAQTGGKVDSDEARAELGIEPGMPVTLLFGRLRPDKGLGELLAALERVPGLHLLVAGQEAGALGLAASHLSSAELAGRVTVREGFLEMTEAARLFAATDTVVLPYRVASQSGVLLLAYGFRRPVIVYPVGGLAEVVIDGQTGWICDRPDVDALVDALSDSLAAGSAECRRRGEAGNRLAQDRYPWPASAALTAQVYREVLAGCRLTRKRCPCQLIDDH